MGLGGAADPLEPCRATLQASMPGSCALLEMSDPHSTSVAPKSGHAASMEPPSPPSKRFVRASELSPERMTVSRVCLQQSPSWAKHRAGGRSASLGVPASSEARSVQEMAAACEIS